MGILEGWSVIDVFGICLGFRCVCMFRRCGVKGEMGGGGGERGGREGV